MMFSRILLGGMAIALLAPASLAQMGARQLLQGAVEKVDEKYKDVEDAVMLFGRNNPSAALSLLAKAHKEHPEIPPAEVMYAQLCFAANKVDAGRAVLEIAVVKQEKDPEPWLMLADLAGRGGQLAASQVLFEKALEKTAYAGSNPIRQKSLQVKAHSGLARIDERRGQWDKAEIHLKRWMELDPANKGAMQRLAAAYFSQSKFDDAKSILEKMRAADKNQPLPEVVMGTLHQRMGQAEESEKMMQEALKKGADDAVTRMAIAEWALTAGKVSMAKENAAAVLKLNADATRAEILTGKVKRYEGDDAGAEAIFRKAYNAAPASFVASNELVLALLAQDDEAKHKQALQYAQVNATRYKDIRTALGREAAASFAYGLHKIGQDASAEKVIQQVITGGEVSPQIGYFAAMIYKNRGRLDVAQELLQKSLSSYMSFPEQESAKKLLEALGKEPKTEEVKTGNAPATTPAKAAPAATSTPEAKTSGKVRLPN